MKILITENGKHVVESGKPEVGKYYTLEDADKGTGAQNRAFHSLLGEYFTSGLWSYQVKDFDTFRDCVKRTHGAGFISYAYADIVDDRAVLKVVDTWQEVPEYIRDSPKMKDYVRGRLKSWTDYTKKERRKTMDSLIVEMKMVGLNSKKFDQILEGMQGIW
jgi:hypothetical protein